MIRYRDEKGRFIKYEQYIAADDSRKITVVNVKYPWETRQKDREHELEELEGYDYDSEVETFDYELGEGEY